MIFIHKNIISYPLKGYFEGLPVKIYKKFKPKLSIDKNK